MSKTLREQLRPLSNWINNLPASPNSWRKEGVDHINVDRLSQTKLGRLLNLDHIHPWEHPVLGRFNSLDNFWYFLKAKNRVDALRTTHPRELRELVDKTGGRRLQIKNFLHLVMWGMYYRVKGNAFMRTEIAKSTLPFDSYRANPAGVRSRNTIAAWFVEAYEEIRKAIQEDRDPNFARITPMEGEVANLHEGILAEILNQPKVPKPPRPPKAPKPKVDEPLDSDLEEAAKELGVDLTKEDGQKTEALEASSEVSVQTQQEETSTEAPQAVEAVDVAAEEPATSVDSEAQVDAPQEQTEQPSVDNNI